MQRGWYSAQIRGQLCVQPGINATLQAKKVRFSKREWFDVRGTVCRRLADDHGASEDSGDRDQGHIEDFGGWRSGRHPGEEKCGRVAYGEQRPARPQLGDKRVAASKTAPRLRRRELFETRVLSGGAGIRTPVRDKIDHSVYVRIPLIEVSSRWPVESPLLDKSPKFSPTGGRRTGRLSRIFDTLKAASGGLL